ncbi:MAG: ribosome biogenesis protein [Euryarchaeota archaeon]|jgi:rRNA maturation protein Nop10|nr:ribosome biogenesis protein [Euryarchaeota archaeon]|tara:strand:+ start:1228 stop:1434 length:207 start_codon:yes stop_codon:yes gene_type:complete
MVRGKLQRCKKCRSFGLGNICKKCGSSMEAAAAMKYSPEDPQGARRRKRQNAGSEEWFDSLPSPREEE